MSLKCKKKLFVLWGSDSFDVLRFDIRIQKAGMKLFNHNALLQSYTIISDKHLSLHLFLDWTASSAIRATAIVKNVHHPYDSLLHK